MHDALYEIANALEREPGGIVVIYYRDRDALEWVLSDVRAVSGQPGVLVSTVDEAIAHHDALVFLDGPNGAGLVRELAEKRDRVLEPPRQFPLVLFLLRGGSGTEELKFQPALASAVRGSDIDPDEASTIDVASGRSQFEAQTGVTPEAWLAEHQDETARTNAETLALYYRARLLTEQRS